MVDVAQPEIHDEAAPAETTGQPVEVTEAGTGFTLFTDRAVVAMRVDGELKDLAADVAPGDVVEPVRIDSPDGLSILRHSAAHVMAQAVQQINPEAKLGIGPPVTDGFYFDFDVAEPFTPEDLKAISKNMERIVRQGQRFTRRVVTEEEARELMADEPYKLELIGLKGGSSEELGEDGESVEVGGAELTVYENVDGKTGEVFWRDLCRGPHLPSTRMVGNGWALSRVAAAYWRGSEKNPQLQRIYGTAWPTKDELRAYQGRIEEALKRDHRRLGAELDLFSFPDEIGSGLAVFHPKGGIIRREMEDYSRRRHETAGYEFVYSPHITKSNLFETSGHLDFYKDGMFPAMHLDEARNDEGEITRQGADYYLKPMNCPMHVLIYRSRQRSYRELPLRLFEFGTVYRNEKSGVIHGLTRVRGMTQDDAHIFTTRERMADELKGTLEFVLSLLRDYGLDDFYLELSTKDPEKFVGSDEVWEEATETLRQVAVDTGLELVPDPAGAAFYGPKISVQARDAIGRTWQMSTIQLDFNLPERFGLEYTANDGTRKQPVMIHRALFGSIERFFGVLTEHYAGAFPVWLSPVQVVGIPVAEDYEEYLGGVLDRLRAEGVRVQLDTSDDRMPKKIRTHTKARVPYQLIAGEDDRAAGSVSFRFRDGTQVNGVPVAEAVERITGAIARREQVVTAWPV
ncbi:threonine--tRNA ligase [Clavibacter michiganensis]|uniref:Threonine--tRNA ligase n=1 Tax=Clavibacter michiganensis subsp. michiganensis (strain NCPPB 382) TaxID=443906 RepID=A5CS13_CLAM3|nr:threonine--tRNA ligase [Clavibacter michiganensis]KAF0259604.1 Threonine--tRNA ligase [Clavibacter michiganensis subsp. michiganensis]MBW8026842.1 threonine--tRNA ligase [Clavibacter michiganensis subsp. michiganensis]MDO4025790.1 threonine--tRNA ligase [Clavibacter michiganensis]MDO4032398.1 threonine--tRNA ligase [Clavibacter michiganensis]MDO4034940.1 threonine--tRNA ligase [Clavibacter michiganensis]